jgi:hypothetical protein
MTEETNTSNSAQIIGHEFSGNICKVQVQGSTQSLLTGPETKKAVYEYRHTIGASHMGLNKFEPGTIKQSDDDDTPICVGYWYLMAGL